MKISKILKIGSTALFSLLITGKATMASPLNLYGRDTNAKNGVVAAAKPEASEVGVKILENGGNAVDAAVATAFAIGVLEPNASGIGGGGFMLIRMAETGETIVIDYREQAPGKATPTMFKVDENGKVINNEITVGAKASGVPGTVAGLLTALPGREVLVLVTLLGRERGF